MIDYQRQYPDEKIGVHYIDFSPDGSYDTLKSLRGWQELEGPHSSLIQGYQEIVWLDHGRVLHVEPIGNFHSAAELISETRKIYR
ncbi:MAG: hypothetical protein ABI557_07035 [Aureliella sp.]